MDDQPITPHATPTLDAEGNLTYVGDDGRRYVVGLPPDLDQNSLERVMGMLRSGGALFQQIESLCRHWIALVSDGSSELDSGAALALLMTTLETALQENGPETGSPEGSG